MFRAIIIIIMKKKSKNKNTKWIITVTVLAFIISIGMSLFSESVLDDVELMVAIVITLLFVILGIIFDIVGVSVTSGNIKVFNSMSSKKVKGAHVAVKLIKNASKVSSVCCDVIGDVCGVASGSAGVISATILITNYQVNALLASILTTAIISMLTIGGKAIGKGFAIDKSTKIIYFVSRILSVFKK